MKTASRLRLMGLPIFLATLLTFLASIPAGASGVTGTALPHSIAHPYVAAPANTAMLTYKNDTLHSGWNQNETILTPGNVGPAQFGKHVAYPVDGQVYTQPLFLPNVTIGGNPHNVAFVGTEHDSVYAFDADQVGAATAPLWHKSFLINGATSVSANDVACADTVPEIGITSTPVIDPATNTLYVVAFTKENGNLVYRLHALDVATGQDKSNPTVLTAPNFNTHFERQRANLLLSQGQIYIAFASFCDNTPYHGFVLSYSSSTLQQTHAFNDTPTGGLGGIWGGDGSMTADSNGNIYLMTGNGTFNRDTGGPNVGDSFVKLDANLNIVDYFAPFNQSCLDAVDADLGSGGPLLFPALNELIGAGKEGRVYVLNMNSLGHIHNIANPCGNQGGSNDTQIVQELTPHLTHGIYSTPSTWTGANGQYVYFGGVNHQLMAFQLNSNGLLSTAPISQAPETFAFPGGNTVVSSNGPAAGIVWAIDTAGVLRAYDATNLAHELYNSEQDFPRDRLGGYVKFSAPTVANGEVFVGTGNALAIYGQVPNSIARNNAGISSDTNTHAANFDFGGFSYSAQALQNSGAVAGQFVPFSGFAFPWPNVPQGTADNWMAFGQTLPVTPVAGADYLGFLGASSGGPNSGTAIVNYDDNTSQLFSLGLSDWTLGAGHSPVSFGNQIAVSTPYRNGFGGRQTVNTYVFFAQVALTPGKKVQSVTLPAPLGGAQMHVFSIATKNSAVTGTANNIGISSDGNSAGASFDLVHNSYSAQALQAVNITPGSTVTSNQVSFTWPTAEPDNYSAAGQVISVAPGSNESILAFLGAAINGNTSAQGTITYTDGSTQAFTLNFSDWTLGGNRNPVAFGNSVVAATAYRNNPTGKETVKTYVFYTAVAILNGKTVKSVTLPNNNHLHVFAVSAFSQTTNASYNNVGTSSDSNTRAANFDGLGFSYSAQALQAAGVTPNCTISTNGYSFIWPNVPTGATDNVSQQGLPVTIPVTSTANATSLGFLGSSIHGPASGTITVTYTDNTTQTFTLGFSDWTLNGGASGPSFGNQVVVTTTYRNGTGGPQTVKTYVFFAQVTLTPGKTVASVTLPAASGGRAIHIFSISTK